MWKSQTSGTNGGLNQFGPQQLKYMTFLNDSSDFFSFSWSLASLLDEANAEEESCLVWDRDLRLFLASWCTDLMVWFHLFNPWSFIASTAPTLSAAIHALLVELIFSKNKCKTVKIPCWWWSLSGTLEAWLSTRDVFLNSEKMFFGAGEFSHIYILSSQKFV